MFLQHLNNKLQSICESLQAEKTTPKQLALFFLAIYPRASSLTCKLVCLTRAVEVLLFDAHDHRYEYRQEDIQPFQDVCWWLLRAMSRIDWNENPLLSLATLDEAAKLELQKGSELLDKRGIRDALARFPSEKWKEICQNVSQLSGHVEVFRGVVDTEDSGNVIRTWESVNQKAGTLSLVARGVRDLSWESGMEAYPLDLFVCRHLST